MLVKSMNPFEITREIKKEYATLYNTTMKRLEEEYTRERRRWKVDKTSEYPKVYCIKTAGKNNWILILRKALYIHKFESQADINVISLVYYYGKKGLEVFCCTTAEMIGVYYGHFFNRYNERMNLGLSEPLSLVKQYFIKNCSGAYQLSQKGQRFYAIKFCNEGIELGEILADSKWMVMKTFVSRDLLRPDQDEEEKELIAQMKSEIEIGKKGVPLNEGRLRSNILALQVMKSQQGNGVN